MAKEGGMLRDLNSDLVHHPKDFEVIDEKEFTEKLEEIEPVLERFDEYLTNEIENNYYAIAGIEFNAELGQNYLGLFATILISFVQ